MLRERINRTRELVKRNEEQQNAPQGRKTAATNAGKAKARKTRTRCSERDGRARGEVRRQRLDLGPVKEKMTHNSNEHKSSESTAHESNRQAGLHEQRTPRRAGYKQRYVLDVRELAEVGEQHALGELQIVHLRDTTQQNAPPAARDR